MTTTTDSLPFLTADLPGIGGVIKRYNEDFVVEEMPLYPASGQGTHIYFTIEKQGLTTLAAIKMVAHALGREPRDIGYAGMKDAHGITRQMLSVEHMEPDRVRNLDVSRIKILSVDRHGNKIKLGHLAGNRFDLKVRDFAAGTLPRARAIVDRLVKRGVPNYFGPQRFGARGDNANIGLAVLCGNYEEAIALILGRVSSFDHGQVRKARELFDAGDLRGAMLAWPGGFREQQRVGREMLKTGGDAQRAWRAVDHTLRKLYISAFQSELFNQVLSLRLEKLDRLLTGDWAWKHVNGACFLVEDAATEQPRCDAFEISPTGPLFGPRMSDAVGEPGRIETQVLMDADITRDQIQSRFAVAVAGGRRPLRVPLKEAAVDEGRDDRGPFLRLCFALPAGSYATNVTREICKAKDLQEEETDRLPDEN
ncbi:MAG: tRNA pseudouridine(13) synthase TruD [Planctomycetota bacterium]